MSGKKRKQQSEESRRSADQIYELMTAPNALQEEVDLTPAQQYYPLTLWDISSWLRPLAQDLLPKLRFHSFIKGRPSGLSLHALRKCFSATPRTAV